MFFRRLTRDEAVEHLQRMPKLIAAFDKHSDSKRAMEEVIKTHSENADVLEELGGKF